MIRRIRLDDVEVYRDVRLRALAESPSAFGSTYAEESRMPDAAWTERTERCANGAAAAMFLAFDGDQCVGLAGCIEDDLGSDYQLISMWVAPSHRGTTIATELVSAVLGWAAEHGAQSVGLWVTRGNDRAQRLYERMGFVVTGDVQPLPSDPCKDEQRMVAKL